MGPGELFELEAGLLGTWPPAPGAPVLPWLPDAPLMLPLLVGFGDLLPGAAFVPPGTPTPGVAPGIGEVIDPLPMLPEPMLPDVDVGRGAIVIDGLIAPPLDEPVPIEPCDPAPIEPWVIEPPAAPILPPARAAVVRQTYFPLPLP
jgi:hypothetical protein